jgi:hypothetical protein
MRDGLSSHTPVCRAFAFLVGLTLAISAVGDTSTPARSESATNIVNLRAGEHSHLRRLLNVATGTSAAPVKTTTQQSNVGDGNASAVGDEIYWDGFELCGDGVIDAASEQCDRSDLGGASCLTAGFTDGTVTCDATCHLDTTQCSGACPTTCVIDADCGVCGPCFPLGAGIGICLH